MSHACITIEISHQTTMVLLSAASEATGFYPDERIAGGAPSEADSDVLSESFDPAVEDAGKPYAWTFPSVLVPEAKKLIPACLTVFDDNDLMVRTMETREAFEAAQVELLRLLEPYTA